MSKVASYWSVHYTRLRNYEVASIVKVIADIELV